MTLAKVSRSNIQDACKNIVCDLCESGYITEKERLDLLYRLSVGERAAYADVRGLMLQFVAQIET